MMRALVVDDNAVWRRSLKRLLQADGFDAVAEAADGQQALQALRQDRPDLILTDLQMPVMDGLQFIQTLRAGGDATPVIMLSGCNEPCMGQVALAAGANGFLPKPVDPEALVTHIHQTMATVRSAA